MPIPSSILSRTLHYFSAMLRVFYAPLVNKPAMRPNRLLAMRVRVPGVLLALSLLLSGCQDTATRQAVEAWAMQLQAVPPAPIQAAPGNRLVIQGTDGNIYTAAPDGSDAIAYTTDASSRRLYFQPTWSPTGNDIAWSMVDQTATGLENRVLISDIAGTNLRQYALGAAPFYFSWRPDGQQIAYLSNASTRGQTTLALGLLDLTNPEADAARTVAQGQPLYFSWDPTGARLLVHISETRIELLQNDDNDDDNPDGNPEAIANTNAGFPAPQWTPDGENIIYATATPRGRQLLLENLTSGEARNLTAYDARIAFDLSPRGDRLAYAISPANAASSALGPLYVVDVNTRSTRELTTAPVLAFFWSPDGEKLAYLATEGVENDDTVQLRLRWYVWDGARSTGYDTILPSRTFLQSYLAFFDQYARSMTIWSPDSTAFAYAGINGDNRTGIWVQELAADAPQRVAAGVFVAWSPR
ncbi:MAG: hypothetical protein WDZ49_14125 [Litorilinea sp.]